MMKIINKLENFIRPLSKKDFQRYFIIFIATMSLLILGIHYYIYNISSGYIKKLEIINKQARLTSKLVAQYEQLQEEEKTIKKLLEKNKDFNMSTFFENITNKHGITPEPHWKPESESIESSEEFEEIVLNTTFKNLTTQKLVTFLSDIYEEKMVYFKDLTITKEEAGIDCNITLATKKHRMETLL